jgi:SAM-dependent methyltransferase
MSDEMRTEGTLRRVFESSGLYRPETICLDPDRGDDYSARILARKLQLIRENYRGGAVLDLCCATGKHLLHLAPHIERGVGIDFSRPYIDEAELERSRRGHDHLEFKVGDALNLPMAEASVDLVYSLSSLYVIPAYVGRQAASDRSAPVPRLARDPEEECGRSAAGRMDQRNAAGEPVRLQAYPRVRKTEPGSLSMSVHERHPNFVSDQRQFFDELVREEWDSYMNQEWDRVRSYEVERLFDLVQPTTILDVGCGCGYHDAQLAAPSFVTRVDAIDYSKASIEKADEVYPHQKVRRWVGDIMTADFPEPYDLVASFHVFEHSDQPEAFLAACARATRPGGHVLICTPNRLRLSNRIRRLKGQPEILCDQMHYKEYVPAEIFTMGKDLGLKPRGWFGVSLTEWESVGLRTPDLERRLKWGRRLPFLASSIGVVMERAV